MIPPFCDSFHLVCDPRRVFDDAAGKEERDDADGDVEEEDPAPVEVVGDVAAEGGSDGRGADDGEAVHGEGLTTLFGREGVGEDGLFGGSESAAADYPAGCGRRPAWPAKARIRTSRELMPKSATQIM